MARIRSGGAADPVSCYRASGYRDRAASLRPAKPGASGSGIV
jgi:L-rhamnose isomerase/sugar isomerase